MKGNSLAKKKKINIYVDSDSTQYGEFQINFKHLTEQSSKKDIVKKINNIAFVMNKLNMSVKPKSKEEYDSWLAIAEEIKEKE